jgi:hypothetical protein
MLRQDVKEMGNIASQKKLTAFDVEVGIICIAQTRNNPSNLLDGQRMPDAGVPRQGIIVAVFAPKITGGYHIDMYVESLFEIHASTPVLQQLLPYRPE